MTLVPSGLPWTDIDAPPAGRTAPAVGLLAPRAAVLDRIADVLLSAGTGPSTLLVVGLRRRDDGWPIPPAALDQIVAVLARELRADDWLAMAGPTEFAVLVPAPIPAAQAAAGRLVTAVNAAAVREMTASAGVAALEPGLSAGEVLRRATLCLATARTVGAGQVITYTGTR
jgi:hypothetical protein